MRVADLLKAAPRDVAPAVRETLARWHVEWEHAIAATPRSAVKGEARRLDLMAYMRPGDRGLSRVAEAELELPRNLRQAIDRRIRVALRRMDALPGAAGRATNGAFTEMRSRMVARARDLMAGQGEVTSYTTAKVEREIAAELMAFEDRLVKAYGGLLTRATKTGYALADVPVQVLGLRPERLGIYGRDLVPPPSRMGPGAGPDAWGGQADELFYTLKERFLAGQQAKLVGKVNQVRTGALGMQRALIDVQAIIAEPRYSAERIMRTETSRVSKAAAQERMKDVGRVLRGLRKEWVSALTNATRESHYDAHGQIVDVDQPFRVGRSFLMYPSAPGAPAAEVVNCLCASVSVVDDAEIDADALRRAA